MSHVTSTNESHHTFEQFTSHVWMSHVTRLHESRPTCRSHDTRMNESRQTYEQITSHVWMSHTTRVNESCHTCEWVMSHMQVNHVYPGHSSNTKFKESSELVTSHAWTSQVYLVHLNQKEVQIWWAYDLCVWHDSFRYVTWLIQISYITPVMSISFTFAKRYPKLLCVSTCAFGMTHLDAWCDTYRCVKRFIQMCDITHT
jgi:hypothetical protein